MESVTFIHYKQSDNKIVLQIIINNMLCTIRFIILSISYFKMVFFMVDSLSGISPFYKESPQELLAKVREGRWQFEPEAFAYISNEAKDFISKLLEKDPK